MPNLTQKTSTSQGDSAAIDELIWLYRLHQMALPFAESLHGWLSDRKHRGRVRGDYCPFLCHVCAEQRVIDESSSPTQCATDASPGS